MRHLRLAIAILALVLVAGPPAGEGKAPGSPDRPLKVVVACSKNQLSHYQKWLETTYRVRCVWAGDDAKKGSPKALQNPPRK